MQSPTHIVKLPKIELHRHLEGSLRLSTLVDVAKQYQLDLPDYSIEALRPLVQMMPNDPHNFRQFLSKFNILRQFYVEEDVVERIAREVVEDAAADNVRYMELRFTPRALCNVTNAPLKDIVSLVCETANATAAQHNMMVRHIISMNRHEPVESGINVLRAASDYRHLGIVGIDLAGDEANYSCLPFAPLFEEAKQDGFGITIHAGEWADSTSIRDAIQQLSADRIGHGITAIDNPDIIAMLIERDIVLEICPSSNFLSGVITTMSEHPFQMLTEAGVRTTINTDDPLICNVTLSDECYQLMTHLNLDLEAIKAAMRRAAQSTLLPEPERAALVSEMSGTD